MLKWEVKLHVDAERQVVKNLYSSNHLRYIVNKVHVLIAAVRPADAVESEGFHLAELCVRLLSPREARRHILLQQVYLGEIFLDAVEEVKDDVVGLLGLAERKEGSAKNHLQVLRVLEQSLSEGEFEALFSGVLGNGVQKPKVLHDVANDRPDQDFFKELVLVKIADLITID